MKKKNDDLLRLAFGELSADAARAVEAQASGDASAQKELEAFRDLRASLQHLPPPPPDGLSTERLRAAILNRELSEKRAAGLGWSWVPVAMAACAALVFFTRSTPRGEPQLMTLNEVPHTAMLKAPAFDALRSYDMSARKSVVPPPVERAAVRAPSAPAEEARSVRYRSDSPKEGLIGGSVANTLQEDDFESKSTPKYASFVPNQPQDISVPSSIVKSPGTRSAMNSDDTVVIVSAKRDLETGAPAATEAEASTVLVGG